MATKFLTLSVIAVIAVISTFSTCKKGGLGCANTVYFFQIGVKSFPNYDSIHIGDTLWFDINSTSTLEDSVSKKMIDYSNAENLGSDIAIEKIINATTFIGSVQSFNYLLIKGKEVQSSNSNLIKDYIFSEQAGYYIFKLGLVAKETGTFTAVFGNAANVYRSSDKCTKASFEINFENTNQHYYLNPNSNGYIGKGGDYYFKVY